MVVFCQHCTGEGGPNTYKMNFSNPCDQGCRFLRYKDCGKLFSLGHRLWGTNYKMYHDLPFEIVELRRAQMAFSKAQPDKLYKGENYGLLECHQNCEFNNTSLKYLSFSFSVVFSVQQLMSVISPEVLFCVCSKLWQVDRKENTLLSEYISSLKPCLLFLLETKQARFPHKCRTQSVIFSISFSVFIYMYVFLLFCQGKVSYSYVISSLEKSSNLDSMKLRPKMFVYGNQPEQFRIRNTTSVQKMQIKQVTLHLCWFTV